MISPPTPPNPQDSSRLMLAVALSLAILLGFHFFYEKPQQEKMMQARKQAAETMKPAAAPASTETSAFKNRQEALAATRRIPIQNGMLTGSISLTGARLDDLSLNSHYATTEKKEHVELLSPSGTADAYYVEGGWTSNDKDILLPDSRTVWTPAPGSAAALTPGNAVILQWNNGQGFTFTRKFELDNNYLFTITQKAVNNTSSARKLNAWHLISRHNLPKDFEGLFIQHEGPLGYLENKLQDPGYKDLAEGEKLEMHDTQGWLGITDKYWFVGLLPPPQQKFDARIIGSKENGRQFYQTDIVTAGQSVAAGQAIENKTFLFAGVKSMSLMAEYEKKHSLEHLDLTFDFGMWYLITKPFFLLLHFLMSALGNVGLGILAMTVIIRAAMFPLANKSFRSMAGMKKIAPQLKELQEKYGKNREKLQAEIFELYKRENVNPFSGCWPLLVQIPVFFALYKSILLSVELRHAPFWGWIDDLSAADPTNIFTLFGLIPWSPPGFLSIGAWPILFCLTMIAQKRLTPPMPDKTQEQLQTYFPYIITFMLAQFSSGLVIYWTWSNVLGVLQQYYILRQSGDQDVSLLRGHKERRRKKPSREQK